MTDLQINGVRLHVQHLMDDSDHDPDGRPPVVMIHDLVTDNLSSYYYTIANPVALVADTWLYDLRGHGRSSMPPSGYTTEHHAGDLHDLLSSWPVTAPAHLVGHGFGGAIALSFADRYPDRVASLVLLDAHLRVDGWDDDGWGRHVASSLALAAFGLSRSDGKDWSGRYGSRKLDRLTRHAYRLLSETTLADDLEDQRAFSIGTLEAMAMPVLAIYGEGSDTFDRAHLLDKHLPDCELHVVPDSEHSVLFEATPYVREQLLLWLERSPSQT